MDSNELLEQEEAFHKLNAEIELRTRQLMKNVETVMNKHSYHKPWPPVYLEGKYGCERKQEDISYTDSRYGDLSSHESSRNHRSPFSSAGRKGRCSGKTPKDIKRKDNSESTLIPPCAKGMSAESLSRFLKAKGKLLQEELEHARRELQMKIDECKKYQQELRNRDEDKLKMTGELTTLREKIKKLETNTVSLTEKLQMRDSENAILKKEVDMVKQDLKKLSLSTSSQETKLNKLKEENEKLKLLLKQAELNEKESRDKYRMKNEEMLNSIRRLEKQKSELIGAIKKQVILIENLKKQKGLLEAEGCLKFTEREFLKLLDGEFGEDRR